MKKKNLYGFIGVLSFLLAMCFALTVVSAAAKDGVEVLNLKEYEQTIYNTTNGLMSNNVSSIGQTGEGRVWIGTDKGLIAYDGNDFSEYGSFYHFDGVNDILQTKNKSAWFATTTYGGGVYLGVRFHHFDNLSDTVSNYATCLTESSDGKIYVGTIRYMACIEPEAGYVVTDLTDTGLFYVTSLTAGKDGLVAGTTASGQVFFIKDKKAELILDDVFTGKACLIYNNTDYLKENNSQGRFYLGTNDGRILVFDEDELEKGAVFETSVPFKMVSEDKNQINNVFFDGNRVWILSQGGIGYYPVFEGDVQKTFNEKNFNQCYFDGFESGFSDMMTDFQGNYWITSTVRGVLLLRKSFFNSELAFVPNVDRVNAVTEYDGMLYVGTDSGILIADKSDKQLLSQDMVSETNPVTQLFNNKKIVDITVFENTLYIAVYGEGTYKVDSQTKQAELISDIPRINHLQVEGENMYILTDGLCQLWNGVELNNVELADTVSDASNIRFSCVLSGVFGRQSKEKLYVGSRGNGIFILEEGKVKGNIDENTGLSSKSVNDLAAYDTGFFIATENGLDYYDGRKAYVPERLEALLKGVACRQVYIIEDNLCVVCEKAVYVIELGDLFNGEKGTKLKYSLFDENSGFFGQFTQNGHGYINKDNVIYIPSGYKLYSYKLEFVEPDYSQFNLLFQSVRADKREMELAAKGENEYEVTLGKEVSELEIYPTLLNFSNCDSNIRYCLLGVDKEYVTLRNSDLDKIVYEDLAGGTYTFWLELIDDEEEIVDRIVLTIVKQQSLFEKFWVKMAGLAAGFSILMYFVFKDRKQG